MHRYTTYTIKQYVKKYIIHIDFRYLNVALFLEWILIFTYLDTCITMMQGLKHYNEIIDRQSHHVAMEQNPTCKKDELQKNCLSIYLIYNFENK